MTNTLPLSVKMTLTPKHRVNIILENPARPFSEIIAELERFDRRTDQLNLDDAQRIEELGVELIRKARDLHSLWFDGDIYEKIHSNLLKRMVK
jgi:hypothetical protein